MPVLRRFLAVTAAPALALALWAIPAAAEQYSELEQRMVVRAVGSSPDLEPEPEGQIIETLEIVRLPVFDEDDPVPDFVNVFHSQSREDVVRRELLFEVGDFYSSERVAETIRNLQLISQFGVVVVVPLRSQKEGHVRVVAIVRDVWSLRANYQIDGSFQNFDYFFLNLSEDNLLGTRTRVGAVFTLQPDRYSLGGLLAHPRIFGSKVDALTSGGVYVNRDSGEAEGSYGAAYVQKDLVSLDEKWAFLAGASWTVEETRAFNGGQAVRWDTEDKSLGDRAIPIEYSTRVVRAGGELTRAFGRQLRVLLTAGLELNRRSFEASRRPDNSQGEFEQFVRDEVPVSDTRLSPFLQLEHRTSRYLTTRNVETLALEESFSLGQHAALRVYPALRGVASSRNLLGTVAWASYTWPLGNGLLRAVAGSSVEHAELGQNQASVQGGLRIVSPRLGFLRVVLDYAGVSTYENYLNRKLTLGGESRPRGYVSSTFRGSSGYAGSLELRTSSINILSARVGAVTFYDVGGAGDSIAAALPNHSFGAGVRVLFPQINRQVFRVDWAAPLTAGPQRFPDRALPGAVYFSFGQAFDVPTIKLPQILSAGTTLLEQVK